MAPDARNVNMVFLDSTSNKPGMDAPKAAALRPKMICMINGLAICTDGVVAIYKNNSKNNNPKNEKITMPPPFRLAIVDGTRLESL